MLSTTFLATSALTLLAGVNAHTVITDPVPFDQSALNNSPLAADGSDFPCKFGGATGYTNTITQMNNLTVGQENTLSIMGGATHGGGSCQISITYDEKPTKDSEWKVIHSIIGGCPNPVAGNADGSPNYSGNPSFKYTLPKSLKDGPATLAWTWFNKIGNREMYMNCAPITISGGSSSEDKAFSSLPNMFVANIGNGCSDTESTDVQFPDPGDSVQTGASATPTPPTGSCAASAGSGSGSGGSASASASDSASAPVAPSSSYGGGMIGSSATAPASSAAATNSGGVFAPGASSSAATTMATSLAPVPAASAPAAAAPSSAASPASSAAPASGSGSSSSTSEQACSPDGFQCLSSTTFIMCANGKGVPQQMADGTQCTAGKIDFATKQVAPGTKRETSKYARHFRAHGHHRRNALGYDF